MSAETIREAARPKPFDTILLGGLIAGVLDGLDAVVFYGLSFGVTPTLLFQNIAGGLLGRRTFHGGWYTVLLGVACHFSIAIGAAAVFYGASLDRPSAVAEALDFRPDVRSAGVSLHALRSGAIVGGAQKNGSSHHF